MKKLAKIFLCLSLALMMSLSLMVPAFAAGTCNHSFKRVIVGTYVWYDNITSMGHQWNKGDLLQCSKCGAKEGTHVPGPAGAAGGLFCSGVPQSAGDRLRPGGGMSRLYEN
jgi:hypothetical protein